MLRTQRLRSNLLRNYSSKPPKTPDKWDYSLPSSVVSETSSGQLDFVTATDLAKRVEPPSGVRMLVRDFIEDSLYNPNYGYFSKQAHIFSTRNAPFEFNSFRDTPEFQSALAKSYTGYGIDPSQGPGRQIWHTPTELFKPWYGQAIAKCLVSEYLLKYYPYQDFVIYEIGGGNGTLASDILEYIKNNHPDVYERTRYTIVEISSQLASIQRKALMPAHSSCVRVVNEDIFRWRNRESAPSFVLAMEVVDNFAHDLIRYDLRTLEPYQGLVEISPTGSFSLAYSRITDSLISSFLDARSRLPEPSNAPPPSTISSPLLKSPTLRNIYANLPFIANVSRPEYIPTRLFQFLQILRNQFPRHRLLLTDFASLPDAIEGANGPVVQTRWRGTTIPCSTMLVKQGFFDIFFPTDFERLRDMYELVLAEPISSNSSKKMLSNQFFSSRRPHQEGVHSASGLPVGERRSSVFSQAEFLETYADIRQTRLRNGENPLLDFYKNVKFLF